MQKRSDCSAQGTSFADDDCLLSSFLSDAWLQKANDCLSMACVDASSCLGPIFN
jgi:hypothetical protein